jgi:hypothetical protein
MATTAKKTTAAPAAAEQTTESKPNKGDDLGQAEVQAKFDEANAQGYWGSVPDETPNENYTLAGVIANKPTPENQRGEKK